MSDLIRKRDIDYISAPIAPVLKGENVHYEYVAFRKQIEDIPAVPAIPIPDNATNGDMIKVLFPSMVAKQHITSLSLTEVMRSGIDCDIYTSKYKFFTLWFPSDWWNAPYKKGETDG